MNQYISQLSSSELKELVVQCISLSDGLSVSDISNITLVGSDLYLYIKPELTIQYFLTDSSITPLNFRHQIVNNDNLLCFMYQKFGEEYLKEYSYQKYRVEARRNKFKQAEQAYLAAFFDASKEIDRIKALVPVTEQDFLQESPIENDAFFQAFSR